MYLDNDDISKKSPTITLLLCLVFGPLGAHRFYAGKYITGLIYFIIGGTTTVLRFFGIGWAFIAVIACMLMVLIDLYAIYSDSFTDSKGKIITSAEKTLIYDSFEEREKIIFIDKLNKLIAILSALAVYIVIFILNRFVL